MTPESRSSASAGASQAINVALGGTLYQHMEGHRQTQPGTERHQLIRLTPGTPLYAICGKSEIYVNSFHHQNVKQLAPGLVTDGVSEDGYIEAFHDPRHRFLLAVQFHPEIYCGCPDDDHASAPLHRLLPRRAGRKTQREREPDASAA